MRLAFEPAALLLAGALLLFLRLGCINEQDDQC